MPARHARAAGRAGKRDCVQQKTASVLCVVKLGCRKHEQTPPRCRILSSFCSDRPSRVSDLLRCPQDPAAEPQDSIQADNYQASLAPHADVMRCLANADPDPLAQSQTGCVGYDWFMHGAIILPKRQLLEYMRLANRACECDCAEEETDELVKLLSKPVRFLLWADVELGLFIKHMP